MLISLHGTLLDAAKEPFPQMNNLAFHTVRENVHIAAKDLGYGLYLCNI